SRTSWQGADLDSACPPSSPGNALASPVAASETLPGSIVPAIQAEGLTKIFGRRPQRGVKMLREGADREQLRKEGLTAAVIDASFDVEPGEIFVVMGLSGSGKSTLIRTVNGLLEP